MWDTLFTLYDRYGPIPRLLFVDLLPPDKYRTGEVDQRLQERIADYDRRLLGKIDAAVKLDPKFVLSAEYGVNCSHTVYTMRPSKMECYKYVSLRAVFGFATWYIGRRIAEATIAISLKDAQRLYDFLMRQGATKTSAGWIFEVRMHQIIQRGGPFVATKQDGPTDITIDIDHNSCDVFSKVSDIGDLPREKPGYQSINPAIIRGYFKPQL